jgi:hypothetical protein
MRTDKELAEAVVNDPTIAEKHKALEREKLKVCESCPDKNECWSCGFVNWYE